MRDKRNDLHNPYEHDFDPFEFNLACRLCGCVVPIRLAEVHRKKCTR
jgi:hypothetical protein